MLASSTFVVLLSAAVVMADNHHARNHHAAIAKRINGTSPDKRGDTYTGKEMTWYPTNTGPDACTGKNHLDSDYFVAMGYDQYGDGSGCCGRKLRINYNGRSAVATCVDECATCPEWGQLDLTKDLFKFFADDLGIGVIHADWSYVNGDDSGDDDSTTTKKTTAHQTTSTHHTTSTTKEVFVATPTHTSSSKKHSSSAKPTSSSAKPSSSSVNHSSSVKPSSSKPASPTEESPSLPSPTEGVANVGSSVGGSPVDSGDPGADSISGALTGSNGAASFGSSKFAVAVSALALVIVRVL